MTRTVATDQRFRMDPAAIRELLSNDDEEQKIGEYSVWLRARR